MLSIQAEDKPSWALRATTLAAVVLGIGFAISSGNGYLATVATNLFVTLLLTVSLHLVVGYLGLFSIAHGAFFGVAAYSAAIFSTRYGVSPWMCLPLSIAVTMLVALIIGIPALRLKGFYLAVATLSFGLFMEAFAKQATDITGGAYGIVNLKPLDFFGIELRSTGMMVVGALCLLLVLLLQDNLIRSPLGRAFMSTRDNEAAATASGIPVVKVRLAGFVISAAIVGVAGWLHAFTHLIVNPFIVGLDNTFLWFFMILVGGLGSVAGAVLGTILLSIGPELLGFASSQQILISGIIMLLVVLFAPRGLSGIISLFVLQIRRALRRDTA